MMTTKPQPTTEPTPSADAWKKWFAAVGELATSRVVQATATLVIEERAIHAKRVQADCARVSASVAPTVDGWLPIETAPKDETEVILACFGSISVVPVRWVMNSYWLPACVGSPLLGRADVHCACCPDDKNYTGKWKGWDLYCAYEPTHWMPLPPAPSAAASTVAPVEQSNDARVDRAYIAGMKHGWNCRDANDNERFQAAIRGRYGDIHAAPAPSAATQDETLIDEVQHRMDQVVEAAVEWHQAGREGAEWFEAAGKLGAAIDSLLELREPSQST